MVDKIISFLGLKRNIVVLLLGLVLAGTGERLWLNLVPKYLEIIGGGLFLIGLFDGLSTFLGAVYAYPGAAITDRIGERKSLVLFGLFALIGYLILYFFEHPYAVIVGAFFFLAWSTLSLPATFTIVASSLQKEKHTMGIGVQSLVRRIPMAIGPMIGGALVVNYGWNEGIKKALLACMVFSVLTMIVQYFLKEKERASESAATENQNLKFFDVVKRFPPELRELLLSDILIRFCERIPYAFVILWAMNYGGVNAFDFSLLITIEMTVAVLCYIPVSHLADKYGQGPFVLLTFIFFTLFPISLMFSHNFYLLTFAFAIRGLKEFGEPARKALIIKYSPKDLKSKSYGAYYLIRDIIVTSGSFLGAFLWKLGPYVNFAGAALFGLIGTLIFLKRSKAKFQI